MTTATANMKLFVRGGRRPARRRSILHHGGTADAAFHSVGSCAERRRRPRTTSPEQQDFAARGQPAAVRSEKFDLAAEARGSCQSSICGEKQTVHGFGERYVAGVVHASIVAVLPDARQQGAGWEYPDR